MFKRITAFVLAFVLAICVIPTQVSAAQTMPPIDVADTVNGNHYTVYDEEGYGSHFSYTVPPDGATVLIFYSAICSNSQNLMSQLNDCNWLSSSYLNVVAVECPTGSGNSPDAASLKQFRQEYIPDAGDNIQLYYSSGNLLWAYFGLYSNAGTLYFPLVLVITEDSGIRTVQYADAKITSVRMLEDSLCAASSAFAAERTAAKEDSSQSTGGCGKTAEEVYQAMIALQDEYPEGMPWTNDNYYGWNGGYYSGGYGCAGFAFLLSDAAFGDAPARWVEEFTFEDIRVGDYLRVNNNTHSVIVLEKTDSFLVLAEGNYNSSIHWGRILSKTQAMNTIDYIFTRYTDHIWAEATCDTPKTCTVCGVTDGKPLGHQFEAGRCSVCGTADPDDPAASTVLRLAGNNRYATAFTAADELKKVLNVEKFDTVIVSSGEQFADALAGSYLAAVKNAPILLVKGSTVKDVQQYIQENLNPGGTVYLLGGKSAVPEKMETGLDGFTVKRLGGSTRYDTNLLILREAGVSGKDIVVCTGKDFADSLSASAVGLPILLVKDSLSDAQKEFLSGSTGKIYVIGGKNAVSERVENQLAAYGAVIRLAGQTRYKTSVLVAETFFANPTAAVLAYGENFPDGLSGGPVACALRAPLILARPGREDDAAAYMAAKGITSGCILGGTTVLPEKTVSKVFGK